MRENNAFVSATLQWNEEMKKQKYKRKSAAAIVAEINARCGTNISARTVRRYVSDGKVGVSIARRGKKSAIPEEVLEALKSAMVSHIQLSNAGMNKMPDRKHMIRQLQQCMKTSMYVFN